MEESELQLWRSIGIKMAEQVGKAVSPLVGKKEADENIKMGADGTPSKLIDIVAEDEVIGVLESTSRPVTLISEEIGILNIGQSSDENLNEYDLNSNSKSESSDKQIIFVVDPLDGTTNAVKRIPIYGISIAIAEYIPGPEKPSLNDVKMGFVKNFATGELYEAIKGRGAFLNGEKVYPSLENELNRSSMGAFIYGTKFSQVNNVCKMIRRMRILGSVAIELSYVSNSTYDAFMDLRGNLRVVDVAAAKLIVEEAGGIITDQEGNDLNGLLNVSARTSIIAAGNKKLHQQIMKNMEVI
ncbi:inositol monophosphatase family protein [Methanobacterium alcaliphilum]|uniref:inositol monophosphatase family protein n=1 Tax=Methanobacterium alcaliphilum TaxID=392018 RepID=UPI002009F99A|nr:inositol monophosphatase family protein [Methanobacterium alcaliphilum]MCK9150933.1 inositol monophosphatase [Methanobacterium alcaliphilum]